MEPNTRPAPSDDPSQPLEAILTTISPAAVARIQPSPDTALSAIRALKRLVAMLARGDLATHPALAAQGRNLLGNGCGRPPG